MQQLTATVIISIRRAPPTHRPALGDHHPSRARGSDRVPLSADPGLHVDPHWICFAGTFACGGMHVQYRAYLSERFPPEVRVTAVAFCYHQGAIWERADLATAHSICDHLPSACQSGPILVTTVVGLAIFLVAVLLSPETKGKLLIADLTVA
jgi:hypothetical protein